MLRTAVIAIAMASLAGAAIISVTVKLAGKSCAFAGVPVSWQRGLVVPACGNVYVCTPTGGNYTSSGTLAIPGACSSDRVFGAGFDR